jgi:division protein CdvB (Snf7/Vps24/ESCRT-III family)
MRFPPIFRQPRSNAVNGEMKEEQPATASTQRIEQLIVDISITKRKLEHFIANLQARDGQLLKRISEVRDSWDEYKLQGLVKELLQIRKIANMAVYSSYLLEVVRLRLETIKFVSAEVSPTLKLVGSLLSEVKDVMRSVSPGSEVTIKGIEENLLDVMSKLSVKEVPQPAVPEPSNGEVKKILKDVQKITLEKINQSFPEVPEVNEVMENTVLEYVKAHKEDFNLEVAERELPLSRNQILAVLRSLDSKGKIHIEYGSEETQVQ